MVSAGQLLHTHQKTRVQVKNSMFSKVMFQNQCTTSVPYVFLAQLAVFLMMFLIVVRVAGIEPAFPAWKAGILAVVLHSQIPQYYSRKYLSFHTKHASLSVVASYCAYAGFLVYLCVYEKRPNI